MIWPASTYVTFSLKTSLVDDKPRLQAYRRMGHCRLGANILLGLDFHCQQVGFDNYLIVMIVI